MDNFMGLRDDSGQWSRSANMSLFSGESSCCVERLDRANYEDTS
jgi:hypothetical protein